MGVNFFFCLSSFLITYILLKEKEKTNTISITSFWIRRILRIWPLYFLIVFFGVVILPLLSHFITAIKQDRTELFYYLLFIYNFEPIIKHSPETSNIGFLWTICVEEQFYLIWPLILFLFRKIKKQYIIFITISLVSLLFRTIYRNNWFVLTYHTIAVFSDMGIGALLAWIVINKLEVVQWLDKKIIIFCSYILGIGLFLIKLPLNASEVTIIFERLLYSSSLVLLSWSKIIFSILFIK